MLRDPPSDFIPCTGVTMSLKGHITVELGMSDPVSRVIPEQARVIGFIPDNTKTNVNGTGNVIQK